MKRWLLIALGECFITPGNWFQDASMWCYRVGHRISPRGAWLQAAEGGNLLDGPMVWAKDGSPYKEVKA